MMMERYVSLQKRKYSNGSDDMFLAASSAASSDTAKLVNLPHITTMIG
jgi:hypothetical protein